MSNAVPKGDAAEKSQDELRAMIESFFRFANVQLNWDGTVNDGVALVFHQMLLATAKCSNAMSFVPRPAGGAMACHPIGSHGLPEHREQIQLGLCQKSHWQFPLPF
ncbi:hypothetical protein AVHY2522_01270 [Acidovorax sp. SUPP2522]|uniref:hypothetical protein n=1 Tax=unclassified Acidovorax TaxID=2684926 RepID=UPI00234A7626|nr:MULTISPECIES: hypothetical protein [unclassified Acidovorax]WCM97826.1 hypothetical protein M5C96_26230 [Acidovorax sp. GBBC 1281]GKT13492.1 hypothetical protein AVHY2522_01270 [Acidovorax sp. SUPP2522]